MRKNLKTEFTALLITLSSYGVLAASMSELEQRSADASIVLEKIMQIPDDTIPTTLLEKAECIATMPRVMRIGFIFGARYGTGVVSCRVPGGWSEPSFLTVRGGSWGLQIGIASVDLILVFVNKSAVKKFSRNNLAVGLDASVAIGPIGREAKAGTDYKLDSEIYSYSRARGLFAGFVVEGSLLTVDKDNNEKIYGPLISAKELLTTDGEKAPSEMMSYVRTLMTYAP